MRILDRLILVSLVIGVWALVLKPSSPNADSGQMCEITSSSGNGEVDNTDLSVYDINGSEGYGNLDDGSVTIHSLTGQVYCY